jgi:predicted Zn-dependent protease
LKAARRPEEVAGVLAHELAHVTQKHGFRKIIESAGLMATIQFLFGDASGMLGVITESSRYLLNQKFSRDFEREADDVGWDCLVVARIDPRGMIDFFKTLKLEQEKSNVPVDAVSFLSTHPPTKERIGRLEKKWAEMKEKEQFPRLEMRLKLESVELENVQ